jgi:hypothetical protein
MSLPIDDIGKKLSRLGELATIGKWDDNLESQLFEFYNDYNEDKHARDVVYKQLSLLAALSSAAGSQEYDVAKIIRDDYNNEYQTNLEAGVDEEFSELEQLVFRRKWDEDEQKRLAERFTYDDDNANTSKRLSRLTAIYVFLLDFKDYDSSIPETKKTLHAVKGYVKDYPRSKVNVPKLLLKKVSDHTTKKPEGD